MWQNLTEGMYGDTVVAVSSYIWRAGYITRLIMQKLISCIPIVKRPLAILPLDISYWPKFSAAPQSL